MTSWKNYLWVWAFVLAGVCAVGWATPVQAQDVPQAATDLLDPPAAADPGFVPGTVLAGVRGDAAQIASSAGITPQAVQPLDLRGADGAQGDGGVTGLRLNVEPGTELAVIDQLRQDPAVVFAEPNWRAVIAQTIPQMVPQAATETPFAVTDDLYADQWYLQRINMSRAWSAVTNDAGQNLSTIRVAVIDTGADLSHPDLAGRLLLGRNYLVPGTAPADDNGHGTHIAGLIAGVLNNGGMAGTALQVRVDPIKALGADGVGEVTVVADAIRDAADGNVRIINLSLQVIGDSTILRSAINYAVNRGVLVIAAAGNSTAAVTYPAAYPDVLAIAATTYDDRQTYYSAEGPQISFAAPGGVSGASILSAWPSDPATVLRCKSGLRQVNGANYCTANGTSMAAGIVSGVAALVWSVRPEFSAAEVAHLLEETAAPIPGSAGEIGAGRVDAARAVRQAIKPHLVDLPGELVARVEPGDGPFRITIPLANPGIEPLTWSITRTSTVSWFGIGGPVNGIVNYGAPATTHIVITPTELITGVTTGGLRITAVPPDGGQTIYQIGVRAANAGFARIRLPWISGHDASLAWLVPGPNSRTVYTMTGAGSIPVDLPFAFNVKGHSFADASIHSDGLLTFPASTGVAGQPNRCLTNVVSPELALYGWWADLNPAAAGSSVSVFRPDNDRFVVEYANVASAAGVNPAYLVSFQIVLHRDGSIRFNYGTVPDSPPARVTAGVEAVDGRYANQIVCRTNDFQLGVAPRSGQTLLIQPEDLY